VLVVVCDGCVGDGGWTRWCCCFSSSSPCRGANPCVLSFSFSFYFPSLGSPLSIFSLFLCFFFLSSSGFFLSLCFLFFFIYFFVLLFLFFFLFPSLLLSSLVFKGKIGGREGDLLPLPSRGVGVGWPGRPLCSCPKGYVPSIFPPCGKQVGFIGVFLRVSEKEGGGKTRESLLLLPLPRASRGRRRPTMSFKTTLFGSFFMNSG